jgi:hypothetical protein
VSIHNGKPILVRGLVAIFFVNLALFVSDCFADDLLLIKMLSNGFKVAHLKVLNDMSPSENGLEISKEVFDEDLPCFGVSQVHTLWIHGCQKSGTVNRTGGTRKK